MALDQDLVQQSFDPNSQVSQAMLYSPNFVNPSYITPDQRSALYARALMMAKQGQEPAKSWAQVFGNMAQAGVGQLLQNRANALGSQAALDQYHRLNPEEGAAGSGGSSAASPSADQSAAGGGGVAPADPNAAANDMASVYSPILNPAGAAGLAGNFQHESGMDPNARGDPRGGRTTAYGEGQWRLERQDNLKAYAAKLGLPVNDPRVQQEFPAVEMGLWGDSSDPGYGSQARAGKALQAAQTPQQATAAALMYLRPQGYSDAHPENSMGYGHRLALSAALMGRQPGNVQVASNGPMAYAPSQAPNAGGMPPVGPGGGTYTTGAPSSAQAPAGPNVVAQNVPQSGSGASPFANMSGSKIAAILADPNIEKDVKDRLLAGNIPSPVGTYGGGTKFVAPLTGPSEIPGYTPSAVSYPGGSAPTITPTTSGGIGPPSVLGTTLNANEIGGGAAPPGGGSAGAQAGPFGPFVDRLNQWGQRTSASGKALDVTATGDAGEVANSRNVVLPGLYNGAQNLHKMQAAIEQYGGKLPTGAIGPDVQWATSLANMLHIGDPQKLADLETFKKNATQYAQNTLQTMNPKTNLSLESAIEANPGMQISDMGNRVLIDHLMHVNALQQRFELAKQQWFATHNNSLAGFQQDWLDRTDGAGAVPLTKYPILTKTGNDGKQYAKVPSTARNGYSFFPANELR